MNEVIVWVDGWQMQCCGTAFNIGSIIEWKVSQVSYDLSPIEDLGVIDYYYDDHAYNNTVSVLSGEVVEICKVYHAYKLDEVNNVYRPVSGKLEKFNQEADGWEVDYDSWKFVAYLVKVKK
ncbi:DUF6578 domain-containing protein [Culicoidibacter larvae]|uniref:Uncharacterized protein n=1 Tax=Culicoidibacter larvae TaxID=2579976 RepID=A0A5R8QFI8_9FIRM|nr:DUF6578 domain-containing protein [Culicoidibacter larvae]TLG75429.1 hypothetical protein FEZ08_05100 [Culicoidibacter larvae]